MLFYIFLLLVGVTITMFFKRECLKIIFIKATQHNKMKTPIIFFLLCLATTSFGQTIAKPNANLLNTAIEQYLKEMKTSFSITPKQFIIETEDKSIYQNVHKKVGSTTILLKTKKELQALSSTQVGQNIGFFTIEVEKIGDKYLVDIIDDGIQCSGENAFNYDSFGAGRACELTFSNSFSFEKIDCLLLPNDPQ